MHEMSVAVALIEQVVGLAEYHRASRVEKIDLRVGEMRHVIPDAMECALRAASQGTVAEGAVLNLTVEPIGVQCGTCDCSYQPRGFNFSCPRCGAADARIVSGNDIVLQSLECDATVAGAAP